ncbi:PAS domain-containing protein [uncultured Tenacibaculum sp.]|uniref:PAS domain-containing protein n=1 Tax=uncultured Tenacibaculum sp. TaxID=174713 RepID=UPI00262C42E9|nr:PAS domain-containing protein [uncultured Tenacibaculum sp.]
MKNNLNNMMGLDLYLSSLNEEEYNNATANITPSAHQNINIKSWGIQDLFNDDTLFEDIKKIQTLTNDFNWENNINLILKNNTYESLVITNTDKKILWVNGGFKKMTGYEPTFAIGKSPTFLQGEKTTQVSRDRIRKKLLKNKPFKEVIVNYKKDKSTYSCELKIFPLYTNNETTHFLALEKEVG